jgi:PHP family Zn ribbon phosphoesterase
MQRVDEIGAREIATYRDDDGLTRADNGRPPFRSLIALQQVVAEALGFGVNTKRVQTAYTRLVNTFGTELDILLNTPTNNIADALAENGQRVAEGVS